MASRFLVEGPAIGNPGIAYASEWENTANVNWLRLTTLPLASGFGVWFIAGDTTAASDRDVLFNQLVSLPFASDGTVSGTLKGQVRTKEAAVANNLRSQIIVRVFSGDGTVERGVAYPGDLEVLTGDPASEWATSFTNRQMPRGGPVAVTEVAYQAGDILVVEYGYRKHVAGSVTGTLEPLPTGSGAHLPEDETETGAFWSWIEFSHDFPLPVRRTGLRYPLGAGLRQRMLRP